MRTHRAHARRALWALPMAALVIGACDDNRTTVFESVGPAAHGFNVSPAAAFVPGGTATLTDAGGDSTITIVVRGLGPVTGGYSFWLVGPTGTMTAAFGGLTEFTTDAAADTVIATVVSAAGTGSFAGSATVDSIMVTIAQSDAAQTVNPYLQHAVAVGLGSAAPVLWRRTGVGASGSLSFGTFGGVDTTATVSASDFVFVPVGNGRANVRGPEFSADMVQMARPPVGYFYRGWLVDPAGVGTLVDVLRSAYSPVSGSSRQDLTNADTDNALPGVIGNAILAAQVRNCVSGSVVLECQSTFTAAGGTAARPFAGYASFRIELAPKAGVATMGRTVILAGALSDPARDTSATN